MRERDVEHYLATQVLRAGGLSRKWASPSHRGVPDRLVLLGGNILAVECKAPGRRLTRLQNVEHKKLRAHRLEVHVIDSKEKVDAFVERYAVKGNPTTIAETFWSAANRAFSEEERDEFNKWRWEMYLLLVRMRDYARMMDEGPLSAHLLADLNQALSDIREVPDLQGKDDDH